MIVLEWEGERENMLEIYTGGKNLSKDYRENVSSSVHWWKWAEEKKDNYLSHPTKMRKTAFET